MIKLIASDLDGTLLQNGAQELTPRALDLIHRLTEKGIHLPLPADVSTPMNAAFSRPFGTRSLTLQKTALSVSVREKLSQEELFRMIWPSAY